MNPSPLPSLLEELMRRHPELDEREARGRIMRGDVLVGTEPATKPGARVRTDQDIALKPRPRFVSRAGEKLDAALRRLGVDVAGKVIVDAGSSTGGFTDCLLHRGASLVYSVDVGRNQIAYSLRQDQRVRLMDGTNVMSLRPGDFSPPPQGAVCDLSFRSIRRAATVLLDVAAEGWLLALVKPQFEWKTPRDDFRGVVQRESDLREILGSLARDLAGEGCAVCDACPSPIPGRKGNREFFYLIRRSPVVASVPPEALLTRLLGERLA